MAQYQHLPIYKQTYDILLRTMSATKDFPREYKYTLGRKIKDELIELVVMIYRANSATDKARHIESIVERVQAIQLMMRLSHDMKILTRRLRAKARFQKSSPASRSGAALSEMTDSLAKQAQGWLRSSEKRKPERF
jgi:MinD-like ATPase involved in chromosome partitioning or flagellar assembly